MGVTVRYENLSSFRRIIAVSDLHGDHSGFNKLLRELHFTSEDALVIVGDIIEKGKENLKLLRHVMELVNQGNVFVTMGNNDILFSEWYEEDVPCENVYRYIRAVAHTTIREMAEELGLPLNTCEDLSNLKKIIPEAFPKELSFLLSLPDILETEMATFVHAGLRTGPLEEQDRDFCLTTPAFFTHSETFAKPVVVGHWPCSNYCDRIIDANARYNKETNVISLDGGNSMKKWQQINYLIIREGDFFLGYSDTLPRIRALEDQPETADPVTVIFPDTNLEILEKGKTESLCYFPSIQMTRSIMNTNIYEYKMKLYCSDFTTYHLGIHAGESLSFCEDLGETILVKREGIVGHYNGKFEFT